MSTGDRSGSGRPHASATDEVQLLATELRSRWRAGEHVCVESLGQRFAVLRRNDERLLDLLYHELLIREEYGEQPVVDEYIGRFPHLTEQLQRQFEVHYAVDQDWAGAGFEPDSVMLGASEFGATLNGESGSRRRRQLPIKVSPPPGYELLEEIGRGGMAVVFKARQQSLNRLVALKMILAGSLAGKQVLARLQLEAKAIAQLQHAGIVQIYEVGEHQGLPFLSLEYVPGGTLQQWLAGRPLPIETAALLIESMARTMQFAHERGVIHRDLKPANVLLSTAPDARTSHSTLTLSDSATDISIGTSIPPPKISDFGLARLLDGGSELTTTGQVIGTPSYMAPEQAGQENLSASPASDIYSLGAILYETLTGRPPFQGATILQTLEQVQHQEPVSLRQLQPRIPPDLETICLKCLDKSPSQRYSTALELAEDLHRFLNHEPISARPSSVIERSRKWIHRRPAVASLLTLIVLLTVFGWAALLQEARRTNKEAQRANRNEAAARRERDDAQKARGIAEKERQNALEAQGRAEANFLKATQVVTKFSELGNQLQNEARQQATSRRIFDAALEFYENVLVERGDDPLVRFQAASAFLKAAEIREILGQQEHSPPLIGRSIELLESLLAEMTVKREQRTPGDDPMNRSAASLADASGFNSANVRRQLASALRLQASNARHFNDYKTAEPAYRRCLELMNALLQQHPDDVNDVVQSGTVRVSFAVMLKAKQQLDDALALHHEAVEILQQATTHWPDQDAGYIELANALKAQGDALWYAHREREVEPIYRRAFALNQELFKRLPNHLRVRSLYVQSLHGMSRLDVVAGEFDVATRRMDEAARLLNEVVSNYPDNVNFLTELLWVWQERLRLETRIGNTAMIDRAARMELSLLGNLMRRVSLATRYDERFALASYRFADWLWQHDRKSESREHYEVALLALKQVATRYPNDASALQQFAWSHAVCPFPELRDISLAESHALRATELTPLDPSAWQALGAAQLRANKLQEAAAAFRRALAGNPSPDIAAPTHALLAVTLHQLEQNDDARVELNAGTINTPSDPSPQVVRVLQECRDVVSM